MTNKITKEKLIKYFSITEKAFHEAKGKVIKGREEEAKEVIEMVKNYISDARYFESQGEFVNAFASINYVHGWLDAGVRLGVFDVDDNKLFTIK